MKYRQLIGMTLLISAISGGAFGLGGDFTLTADDGSSYSLADSRGQLVVLSFGYTYCPDVCPTALAVIGNALNSLGEDAEKVDALFVSLDPDRDTPEHLRVYTRFFHSRLRGLTGAPEQLHDVAERYRVRYQFVGKGEIERYTMDHSASLYLIDTQGELLRILPHGLPPNALADSLRMALVRAEQKAKIPARQTGRP